ncbi:IS30 family transposase [Xenorhabdus bovienii]|uniref:Transposase n=2 Tax=Xenorhabdus bovienii TaxID=40576 RepID=A0A077NQU7_XENBV|nr:IS30 family transposase [Xenorhabdus bovienii]CDG86625.1 transposase [Xenorhabdus bovienii str. feltiae France]CDG93630.1 transposase [Xenorhabdus bovienii str. feltiae Florida]CDH01235.1 transposase [Xenorhabdus bovienii str. feltiae Moldova]
MAYTQLTEIERYQIFSLKEAGFTQRFIATSLNRNPSTISRELKRNQAVQKYCPQQAQLKASERRHSALKAVKVTPEITKWINQLIWQDLSPEQTVGYLKREMRISLHHETIYRLIYKDKINGGDLWQHLRIAKKPYRKRYGSYERRGKIKNRVSIDKRPKIVDKKQRIGDWEGDTIVGKDHKSALLTLVERKSLFTLIIKLENKTAEAVAKAATKHLSLIKQKIKTITFDNGLEFAEHELISRNLGAKIYFFHPYSPWERGINENTNGLIRDYFPKGTDFNRVSELEVNLVANRLNKRPRKTRGYKTPDELFKGIRTCLLR